MELSLSQSIEILLCDMLFRKQDLKSRILVRDCTAADPPKPNCVPEMFAVRPVGWKVL